MTVEEYIKTKEKFRLMPFVTVYATIMELINDGHIDPQTFENGGHSDVEEDKPESEWETCRRLYGARYFHSNR